MNLVFKDSPEIKTMLSDALFLTNEFSQGKHPGDIIHDYATTRANNSSLNNIDPNLYSSLQVLDLFSQSLRSKQANQYWISSDSLKLLFDNTTLQIYLGLIYQQASPSGRRLMLNNDKATEILEKIKTNSDPYRSYLTNLLSKGESINYYFRAIKEKQLTGKDQPTYQDYYSLFDASLNLIEYVIETPQLGELKALNKNDTTRLNQYFKSLRSFGNIYVDIYEKQYTSAIVEFCSTYSDILKIRLDKTQDKAVKQLLEKQQQTVQLILKYGNFATTIAKAENSDEVQNAIEAIALPAGSSRIKRESVFNVSLNAYCGLFVGQNRTKFWSTPKYSAGVTAPIGVAISWGHSYPFKTKYGWSTTIFASIIDVGAIASYRFSNSTDTVPKINLSDIISPGLFISWGIPKCPISFNIGCQMAPLLTAVSAKENTFGEKTLRFTASICVDLPLLNLYNKSR